MANEEPMLAPRNSVGVNTPPTGRLGAYKSVQIICTAEDEKERGKEYTGRFEAVENVEIRLHQTVLYSSIYRADHQLLVNQHTYGIPAAQAPVFCLRDTDGGEMATLYFDSFERAWAASRGLA